jgi:hypothetical protein
LGLHRKTGREVRSGDEVVELKYEADVITVVSGHLSQVVGFGQALSAKDGLSHVLAIGTVDYNGCSTDMLGRDSGHRKRDTPLPEVIYFSGIQWPDHPVPSPSR